MTAMSLVQKVAELQKRIVSVQSKIDSLKEEENYTFKDLGLASKTSSFKDLGLASKADLSINIHKDDEHYDLGIEILSILDQCDSLERDKMNLIEFMNNGDNVDMVQILKDLEDVLFESDHILDELIHRFEDAESHLQCGCISK